MIVLLLKFTVVQKHIIHESEVLNMGYIFSLRKKKWLFWKQAFKTNHLRKFLATLCYRGITLLKKRQEWITNIMKIVKWWRKKSYCYIIEIFFFLSFPLPIFFQSYRALNMDECSTGTRQNMKVTPKVMPSIYFYGNYNIYKANNHPIW